MVAGRARRPFSLDQKLPNLDQYLPAGAKIVEIRLLSVEKEYRNGLVFSRLAGLIAQHFRDQGANLAIISGTVRQLKLYAHLGFVPFGPVVGSGDAQFQPMYLTLDAYTQVSQSLQTPSDATEKIMVNFLPGPVGVHEEVRRAFESGLVSHRSDAFVTDFQNTRTMLCELTGAQRVEIMVGSGSLANDAVCAQLSLMKQPGLILSNGEFGDRLIDHATRQKLEYETCRISWGDPFDYPAIERRLQAASKPAWLWAVHCETSTGILNQLETLKRLCAAHGVRLALDCISAIGTVPVDLRGVYLASCVSGKALASYPGLSMVFYNHELQPSAALPRYLDLGYYAAQSGIPFTHSSNLVYALQTALKRIQWTDKFRQIAEGSGWLRERLRALGFQIVAPDIHASPAVISIALPPEIPSKSIGWQLRKSGYLLSYNSEYLRRRNWIQICIMGEFARDRLETLPEVLSRLCAQRRLRKEKTAVPAAVDPA